MDKSEINWFTVRDAVSIEKLGPWLKRQRRWNTFLQKEDRTGAQIFMLGWDDKPDCDWGRFKGYVAAVRVTDASLPADAVEQKLLAAMEVPNGR